MTTPHAQRAHSLYSPSSATMWMACPGSPILTDKLREAGIIEKDESSEAARFGTAIHEMCAYALLENCEFSKAITWACEGYPEFKDRIEAEAASYKEYVDCIRGHMDDGYLGLIEHKMDVADSPIFGTSDAVLYSEDSHTLRILDIKTGKHLVPAQGNIQLAIYAALAIRELGLEEIETLRVILGIYQPARKSCWSMSETLGGDVMAAWEKAQEAANTPFTRESLVQGKEQCRWCRAKYHCPAFARSIGAHSTPKLDELLEKIFSQEV